MKGLNEAQTLRNGGGSIRFRPLQEIMEKIAWLLTEVTMNINAWKDYEKRVREVADELRKTSLNLQNAEIRQGTKNKIEGASGYKHQIDVSMQTQDTLVLIECKRYKSKVALSDMLVLIARMDDISKKKKVKVSGAFFTTVGFTDPAKKIGRPYEIDLNTFQEVSGFAAQIAGNVLVRAKTQEVKSKAQEPNTDN